MKNKTDYKKVIKILLVLFLVTAIIFLAFNQKAFADVGNNNNYDMDTSGGGGGDVGDVGDSEGAFWIIYFIFQIFGPIGGLIVIMVLFVGFFLFRNSKAGKKVNINKHNSRVAQQVRSDMSNDIVSHSVAEKIRKDDPNFSEDAFIGWAREVFMKIQQAWNDRNWKTIRPFETQELFSQHNQQLEEYIKNNKINKLEKICIRSCWLKDYSSDGDKEILIVELHATMRDYVVDATTNQVLESDPNLDWFMKYNMIFNRKKGVLTEAGRSNKSTTNCPNCGAPTEITSAGQCEYCKSIITTGEHDWVLSNIVSIK